MVNKHDMVGKQLGDYLIKEKLATGGMSYVFLGEDVTLGRRAAVKVLTPDITEDDDSLPDRFKREARAVAQLEHNNIIPIYQFGELEGVYFLAMRFIEGHDFADEINDARREGKFLDIKRAIDVLLQVASALDYAHANGIVHRDIKPSNILIDNNSGKAILTDFGLVLWSNVDKTLGTAFGTPRYISPEQATDSQAAVAQSDIYSLAVIFYEIVTGKMLFTGQSPMEMAISHITEKPVPPRTHNPKVPVQVEREILRALDKEPNNRHKSATEFINALRQAYRQAGTIGKTDPKRANVDEERVRKALASTKPAESMLESWDDSSSTKQQNASSSDSMVKSAKPGSTVKLDESEQSSRIFVFGGLIAAVLILGVLSVLLAGGAGSSALPTIAVTNTAEGDAVIVADVTNEPTTEPTDEPTVAPTDEPTLEPTATDEPTDEPTATDEPTLVPTETNTPEPTEEPTITPTITVTPSPTPTATDEPPATDYPILQDLPDGVPVRLFYDMTLIALRNNSEGAVVFSEMRLSGLDDDGIGEFDGSTLPSVALLPGECVVIRSETIPVPVEWECVRERSNVLLQTPARFWFADSNDDATFQVFWRSNEIKTCDTVGRAVGNVDTTICDLEWPVVADG